MSITLIIFNMSTYEYLLYLLVLCYNKMLLTDRTFSVERWISRFFIRYRNRFNSNNKITYSLGKY